MTTARRSCSAIGIKAGGGQRDGEEVLDMLAAHPSTARFIATKLVQTVRERQPAGIAGRPRGGDVPEERRGSPRGDANHSDIAGISLA